MSECPIGATTAKKIILLTIKERARRVLGRRGDCHTSTDGSTDAAPDASDGCDMASSDDAGDSGSSSGVSEPIMADQLGFRASNRTEDGGEDEGEGPVEQGGVGNGHWTIVAGVAGAESGGVMAASPGRDAVGKDDMDDIDDTDDADDTDDTDDADDAEPIDDADDIDDKDDAAAAAAAAVEKAKEAVVVAAAVAMPVVMVVIVIGIDVYRSIMSVQRWKTASVTCKRQLIAVRNVISFIVISCVLSPDILLHARAE